MPYSMIGSQYSKARSIQSAKLLFYFFIDINKIERNLTSSLALTEEILKQVEMELTVSSDGEKHIFSHCFDGCCHHCKKKHCYLGISRAGKSFCTLSRPSSPRIKFSQRRESPFFGENPIIFIGVIPSCHRDIKNQFVGLNADD